VVAVKVDWERFGQANAGQMRTPLLEGMRRHTAAKPVRGAPASAGHPVPRVRSTAFVEELTQASPVRRGELWLEFVAEHVARSVGAPDADAIDPTQPLSELGLDSLMAVELRNQLGAGLGLARSLPATLVFDHPTLQELADYLSREIVPASLPVAPRPSREQPANVTELSDAEVDELFAQRLKSR
jgi:acyl carrier protein